MQSAFDFAGEDVAFMRRALTRHFGPVHESSPLTPEWRLVRSLIGARTYDTVADPAFGRLRERWPNVAALAAASSVAVENALGPDVTFAADKAVHLTAALRRIEAERGDHDLGFLRDWPVHRALAWLERLPGVGPKVAAATLNASTLAMPAFIVDGHVYRILLRFGFIGARASAREGRDAVTGTGLGAEALLELFRQMKRLGQTLCRPYQARCDYCPLWARCQKRTTLGMPTLAKPDELDVEYSGRVSPEEIIATFQSLGIPLKTGAFPGGPRLSG